MARSDPAAAARAAMPERYGHPTRTGRVLAAAAVMVLVGGGLGWLLHAAVVGSTPEVDAGVAAFEVVSDRRTEVTLEVVRRADTGVRCEVFAQAGDKQVVGERSIELPPAPAGTESVTVTITTERRATTADVRGCTAVGG